MKLFPLVTTKYSRYGHYEYSVENYSVVTKEKLQYSTTEIRSCLCKPLNMKPIRDEFSTYSTFHAVLGLCLITSNPKPITKIRHHEFTQTMHINRYLGLSDQGIFYDMCFWFFVASLLSDHSFSHASQMFSKLQQWFESARKWMEDG